MAAYHFTHFFVLIAHPWISAGNFVTSGTQFKIYSGEDIKASDESSSVITRHFHECGMKETCNYLVRKKNTSDYSKISGKEDISNDKIYAEVWKKIEQKEMIYRSCKDVNEISMTHSSEFKIYTGFGMPVKVYCDMTTDGGGWTIIQRRVDASIDSNRTWQEYKQGFGDPASNFWIGLDHINSLTSEGRVKLRIELKSSAGDTGYGTYESFKIANEVEKYTLTTLGNFTGTIGDSMTDTVGRMFSTWDQDNDKAEERNCGIEKGSGWWYGGCSRARLNGFLPSQPGFSVLKRIKWITWDKEIIFTEMKLRKEE